MALFQNSVLNKYLKGLDKQNLNDAYERFTSHFHNPTIQENIRNNKEEQYQGEFLIDLFVDVLGYTKNPTPDFNLTTELKNIKGSKKTDGAILKGDKALAVIELKGTNTTDLSKVETQAFGYKNNQPGCNYVITSNFEKLRFYIDNAVDFEEFNLFQLSKERFEILWLCLSSDYLLKDSPKKIKDESLTQEENVTKKLYKDYASFRNEIFDAIQKENPEYDKLTLFKKTQKLLDRFLFIFFAEDRLLLPPNSIRSIVNQWTDLRDKYDAYVPLYNRFKKYFEYMNTGHKGQQHDIFAYNGGLFAPDDVLDHITINDDLLHKHTLNLSNYDFESEVSVNILGHIFEHSLNDIDEIQAEIQGTTTEQSKTKRKKDGVFYTPKYITKYIVDNTVGKLCEEKKAELDISDETYQPAKQRSRKRLKALQTYRDWLLQLTICDPACGSGAFLNQALEFLIAEHAYIDELSAKYNKDALILSDVENAILENNLFGVDINEESVEIAKLSLWLRTAQKGRKLTALNNNIKCGNSLIDDPTVAGDKAFNWETEFPEVFNPSLRANAKQSVKKEPGFDVIIGNPPYGILIDKDSQKYYNEHFPLTKYKTNLYILFIERMLQIFDRGIVHFIIPKSLLFNTYYEDIRRELINVTELNEIYTITEEVFEDADVGSSLLLKFTIKEKNKRHDKLRLVSADKTDNFLSNFNIIENYVSQDFFLSVPNCEISVISSNSQSLLKKLYKLKQLKQFYRLKNGLNPGNIKHILISNKRESEFHKPITWGKEISRYNIVWGGDFVIYDENIGDRISLDEVKSKKGMKKQNRIDFALRSPELFENKKILVRKTGDSLIGSLDEDNFYFDTLVHGIYQKEDYYTLESLLAIINSNPATKFYRLLHDIKGKVFAKISLDNLGSFPIPEGQFHIRKKLDLKAKTLSQTTKVFAELSSSLLMLLSGKFSITKFSKKLQNWHDLDFGEFLKELEKARKKVAKDNDTSYTKLSLSEEAEWMQYFNEQKQKAQDLKAQINQTDAAIDAMVYELYGLTEEEIEIVENS